MTTIVIRKTEKNRYIGFTCMGHAGYADHGADIVCAAVSVLVINTINAMEKLAGQKPMVCQNEETGFIKCDFESVLQDKSVFLMDSLVFSLQNLSKEYGEQYLQVNFEEV